jgi:hypothetical protein
MAGPFTFPVARAVPFDNTGTNPAFVSENVRDAIIEAVQIAATQSRSLLLAQYNGNANTGRYLEFFGGISSLDAPIRTDLSINVFSIVSTTTATGSTALIGFFDLNVSSVTPLYTLDMNSLKTVFVSGTPLFTIAANSQLAIRVTSGSIAKPHIQLILG